MPQFLGAYMWRPKKSLGSPRKSSQTTDRAAQGIVNRSLKHKKHTTWFYPSKQWTVETRNCSAGKLGSVPFPYQVSGLETDHVEDR